MVSPAELHNKSTPGSVQAPSQKPPTAEPPVAAAASRPSGQPGSKTVAVSAVYSRLLELCPPFAPASPWEFLKPDADCRECPASASDLLAALERDFSPKLLQHAGVAQKISSGAVELNPKLTAEGQPLVVLRDRERLPFDIATPDGCLSRKIPLLQFWRDRRTRRAARESEDWLLATPTLIDAVLLRSAGLAAAPMTRLDRLGLPGLRLLEILTDGPFVGGPASGRALKMPPEFTEEYYEPAEETGSLSDPDCPKTCYLKLLPYALHPAGGEISEEFTRVARTLAGARRHLGIRWGDVRVWWPTDAELEGLIYCRQLRSAEGLREFLLSQDRTHHHVREFRDPVSLTTTPDPLADYVEARQKLLKTRADLRSRNCSNWNLRLAQENFERLLEQAFAAPLLGEASASEDPIRRTQLVALADLVRWFHKKLLEADEHRGGDPPSEAAGKGRQPAAGREGKDLVAMLERVVKLGEQIRETSS